MFPALRRWLGEARNQRATFSRAIQFSKHLDDHTFKNGCTQGLLTTSRQRMWKSKSQHSRGKLRFDDKTGCPTENERAFAPGGQISTRRQSERRRKEPLGSRIGSNGERPFMTT